MFTGVQIFIINIALWFIGSLAFYATKILGSFATDEKALTTIFAALMVAALMGMVTGLVSYIAAKFLGLVEE